MSVEIDQTNNGTKIFTPLTVRGNTNIIEGNLNVYGNLNVDNWSVIKQLDMYNKAFFHGYTRHTDHINAYNVSDVGLQDFHTASFLCNGGAAVLKNLVIGGDLHLLSNINIKGNISITGNTIIQDRLLVNSEDESYSTQTGSGIFKGGIGIMKNINIGHNIVVADKKGLNSINFGVDDDSINDANISLKKPSTIQIQGAGFIKEDLYVGKNVNIVGNLTVHGSFTKLLTENIVADDPLIVLGANSTRQHDDNPSGFVTKYGNLNSDKQYVHQFTGLIRMPNNHQQHNLWIQMNKPYSLVSNLDVDTLSSSDDPLLKNSDNTYINFNSKDKLSDLNIRNLSTYGHINIKGNVNIESSGFLKIPVGDVNNRPKGVNFDINQNEQLISTINHPYRNTNGLLRLNINNDDFNKSSGNLELYYVKQGKRYDGKDFYHNDDNNDEIPEQKGKAGWRNLGPYRLENLDGSSRIEVENNNLINDQVISFFTSNKLRMTIFPDRTFNNNTSYHRLAVNENVLEGGISMGKVKNPLYNIKGFILNNNLQNINNIEFYYPQSLTVSDLEISSDKIRNLTNVNSYGVSLKISINANRLSSVVAIKSGKYYNAGDKILINLDSFKYLPSSIELIIHENDLTVINEGKLSHIGFNIPQSTLDIAGNLNVLHNITSSDFIGIQTNKVLSFSNDISDGSVEKPFRNYITCINRDNNNLLYIQEIKNYIEKNFYINIPDGKYSLNHILDKIKELLNENSLIFGFNYNYDVYIENNKIVFEILNLQDNEEIIFEFSKNNSISNDLGFKIQDYKINYNDNKLISNFVVYEDGTNNLFNINTNKLLKKNLNIEVSNKIATINYNNKHNINSNTIFNVQQKITFYFSFDTNQYIYIPNQYAPQLSSQFTFMTWINIKNLLYNKSTIYFQGDIDNNVFIKIYIDYNKKLCISFNNLNEYKSNTNINFNVWTHISINLSTIQYNSTRILNIYINGSLDNTEYIDYIILNDTQNLNKNYYIGSCYNKIYYDYFTGYISDLVIFNEVKSSDFILEYIDINFNNYFNKNINDTSLIFYLPPLKNDYINIVGLVTNNIINSKNINVSINSNKQYLEDFNFYINNKKYDTANNSNITYKQNIIILDNLDNSITYHINNAYKTSQITQNNDTLAKANIISLNNGSNIELTINKNKNIIDKNFNKFTNYNYKFNNNINDTNPGNRFLKFNDNIHNNTTQIFINSIYDVDIGQFGGSNSINLYLETMLQNTSVSSNIGIIIVYLRNNKNTKIEFTINSLSFNTYWTLNVVKISNTNTTQFNNSDNLQISIKINTNSAVERNWIPNTYTISDENPDLDVTPGVFDINIKNDYTTDIYFNKLSSFHNYRIGDEITINDIRNGSDATFQITIQNDIVQNILVINTGTNYKENDILIISKENIDGVGINNKSSQNIKIVIFKENINSDGSLVNTNYSNKIVIDKDKNILQQPKDADDNLTGITYNTIIQKGTEIKCKLKFKLELLENVGWNVNSDPLIHEKNNYDSRDAPPTKLKTNVSFLQNIDTTFSNSFKSNTAHYNSIYDTSENEVQVIVGINNDTRDLSDKAKFRITIDQQGAISEIKALRGNNYREGDILLISNNDLSSDDIRININDDVLEYYNAGVFTVDYLDLSNPNSIKVNTNSNLNGYLIGTTIKINQNNNSYVKFKISKLDGQADIIIPGTNWIPNYYSLNAFENLPYIFNVLVDNNTISVSKRNDTNLNNFYLGEPIILKDNRNGNGANINISILNNIVTIDNVVNAGINYKNNDILIIDKNNINGSNNGKASRDIHIQLYEANLDNSGSIITVSHNNKLTLSTNNIIQHTVDANNITNINFSPYLQKGDNIILSVKGYFDQIVGNNWKQGSYIYKDTKAENPAVFDVNVDKNGIATAEINFTENQNGIDGYSNNYKIIIPDQTIITNTDKIKIQVIEGEFNNYNIINYNYDNTNYEIGFSNNIYNLELIIENSTPNFSDYTFLKNTKIIQKYIKLYNNQNINGAYIPINNNLDLLEIDNILYGNKILNNNSTDTQIVYDVYNQFLNNVSINTDNYRAYVDLLIKNHNLNTNSQINITNLVSEDSVLHGDKIIKYESPTIFSYNTLQHIDNNNSDIKLKIASTLEITYTDDNNNLNDGIYNYIDNNPPTSLLTNFNFKNSTVYFNQVKINGKDYLDEYPNESFEYITSSNDIHTTSSTGINTKFKIIIINSVITYIYALDGINYNINDEIDFDIKKNNIIIGTYRIRVNQNNILNNKLKFNINVLNSVANINLVNPEQCPNYNLNHLIYIPKNITGFDTNEKIQITISNIHTLNSTSFINSYWTPTTESIYFTDKLYNNNTYTENKYFSARNVSNCLLYDNNYNFDGNTNYVKIENAYIPNLLNTDFTIEFWSKFNNNNNQKYIILELQDNNTNNRLTIFYELIVSSLYIKLNYNSYELISEFIQNTNQWKHYAFTFNKSENRYLLYENNILLKNKVDSYNIENVSDKLIIGSSFDSNNYFNGKLKKIKFWNTVRTLNQIIESCYSGDSLNDNHTIKIDNDFYYLDMINVQYYDNLLLYIPLNFNNNNYDLYNYSYLQNTYKYSPALFKIDVSDDGTDNDNITVNINLISNSCVNYTINDQIIVPIPITIETIQINSDTKQAIIDFGNNHNLFTNDYIFITDYYSSLVTNDYLQIEDNLPYIITIKNSNKISFNLSSYVSSNLDINLLQNKKYHIFKTTENKTYNNNIITNFVSDNTYNDNILYYSLYKPGNEILKIRSNGILQLVANQENNNTLVDDNDKGTQIHLLANNQNSQIYLQSKESTKYDSIKIKSDNGGIDIDAKNNVLISSPLLNQNSSNIYFNTNTGTTNSINLTNFKGENTAINLLSMFGNINLNALENDLVSIDSGKILLKSKGDIITLTLSDNITVNKYDIITQLNINTLQAIVYQDTIDTNIIKVKMIIEDLFSKDNNNKIIINGVLTNIHIINITADGLLDAITIQTDNKLGLTTDYQGFNDIITIRNNKGNKESLNSAILDPYFNFGNNNKIDTDHLSSILLESINGGITLKTYNDKYVHLNGGKIAISSHKNDIHALNLFTNSGIVDSNETINIINFSGYLDNNSLDPGFNDISSIQIISKKGGTKLEVHKNKQLLIQTKHYDDDGNHADESTGLHGYLNIIANGLSDVGPNVPFNISSSGGINISSGQRTCIHSSHLDQNNSMILHSLGGINFKADANNNIECNDKMNLISKGNHDVGLNVAFNIYSSAGINITSIQKTSIHSSNLDEDNSMLVHTLGGINFKAEANTNIIGNKYTNINSLNEDIHLSTKHNKQTIITNEDQALLNGSGSLKVMGGAFISKDLIVNQNITVVGNFTVLGNKTEINTDTLIVDDPLIVVGANNVHSDNYYGGIAIKHSVGKILINDYNNKLYIEVQPNLYTITIDTNSYTFDELRQQLEDKIKFTPLTDFSTEFTVILTSDNQIQFTYNSNVFILHYQNSTFDYPNNILSTIGYYNTQKNSNTYIGNKLSFYKFSGLIRKPNNNRFYLVKDQKNIITTSGNVDTSSPDFTLKDTTQLIKTELELSKIILNDGSINTSTYPTEGVIQYNINNGYNLLNAYIKEYPTNILKHISLSRYSYTSIQFYFNDLSDIYQWGNRVSGQVDPDVAIFSKRTINRFTWIGNQNIYITHIEINVDEYNNNELRKYQLRLIDDNGINNLQSVNKQGVLFTTTNDNNKSPILIDGRIIPKEINVIPISSNITQLDSDPNFNPNIINDNTLEIVGGVDKFIGMQLRALTPTSIKNEVIITLRGYTSFY